MYKTTLKDIPSISKVINELSGAINLHEDYLKKLVNEEISKIRMGIKEQRYDKKPDELLTYITNVIIKKSNPSLLNIINGTGIVLHTGFGRAPFRAQTLKNIAKKMEGYVNLEFDLSTGKRGDRQQHIRDHISAICHSDSALTVNNNAAAVMLAINTLADQGEVIVSRGQLVEIGGSFRIPDIIQKSGAILKEVGTTNRTHIKDYQVAISKNTKLILWVHTSNYVIKGFTNELKLHELIEIGRQHKIPVMVDWGSGAFLDMKKLNIADEIPVRKIMKKKPDVLTFSGDKLIGGPQSGIAIGKKKWIDLLKKNTLYRTLRCDKVTIGLLEETLRSYRSNNFTKNNLALSMITTKQSVLRNRANKILSSIRKKKKNDLGIKVVSSKVEAGSGSLPEQKIDSISLLFDPKIMTVSKLSRRFRIGATPVVGYVNNGKFYIDLKAVLQNQINDLIKAIENI